MNTEVLLYISRVKEYFQKHENDLNYFTLGKDVNLFFEKIEKLSIENFEKNGTPELTREQFDKLKNKSGFNFDFYLN